MIWLALPIVFGLGLIAGACWVAWRLDQPAGRVFPKGENDGAC